MTKGTHYLLLSEARTLSIRDVFTMGEDGAFATFCKLRWPATNGEPVCPRCGSLNAYKITSRRKFKCRDKATIWQASLLLPFS